MKIWAIVRFEKTEIEVQKRSYTWLGKKLGISRQDISKLLSNLEKGGALSVKKLEKIANTLKVEITELLRK